MNHDDLVIGNIKNEECKIVDMYYDDRLFVFYIINKEVVYVKGFGESDETDEVEFKKFLEMRLFLYKENLISQF